MSLTLLRIGGAMLSGLSLAASFPRMDQYWLAWIGLVPLLVAVRGVAPRRAAALGWIAGFVFFLVTIYWIPDTISNFTRISPLVAKLLLVLLAAFSAYAYALLAFAVEWAALAGVSRMLAAPVVWVVLEWMRGFVVAGFPWNLLGYSQLPYTTIVQAADLGGVYLLSSVLVLANAALASALVAMSGRAKPRRSWSARLALAAACPLLLYGYGTWRLDELHSVPYTGSLRVGITQGNIAQDQKWDSKLRDRILARYLDLTDQAAAAGAQLVVWPEAALPFYLQRDMRSLELTRIARERGIDLLVGAPGLEDRDGTGKKPYNQAWLVRSGGEVEGPYDKIQLVPFGEYIPLHGLFGMVEVAVQAVGQFGRGTEYTIFETVALAPPLAAQAAGHAPAAGDAPHATAGAATAGRPARFATLICYEGIFPALTRTFAARGADFLVNISNDAWYGDTAAPQQHLLMAAMRTIENRMPMVRSTNTGISAFITDEGKVGPTTPLFEEDMVVETVLVRDVWSFYRAYGDVFLHLCQAALVVIVLLGWHRRRRGAAAAMPAR